MKKNYLLKSIIVRRWCQSGDAWSCDGVSFCYHRDFLYFCKKN